MLKVRRSAKRLWLLSCRPRERIARYALRQPRVNPSTNGPRRIRALVATIRRATPATGRRRRDRRGLDRVEPPRQKSVVAATNLSPPLSRALLRRPGKSSLANSKFLAGMERRCDAPGIISPRSRVDARGLRRDRDAVIHPADGLSCTSIVLRSGGRDDSPAGRRCFARHATNSKSAFQPEPANSLAATRPSSARWPSEAAELRRDGSFRPSWPTPRVNSLGQLATGLAHEINSTAGHGCQPRRHPRTVARATRRPGESLSLVTQIKQAALRAGTDRARMRNFVRRGECRPRRST